MNKVSVILPCFNGSQWISRAIKSILAQTYRNFELVIVDDGSNDNSQVMISQFLNDGRVRYIRQKNRGFSGAINSGIKASTGNFIGFIGQDDLWLPNKLELQANYFDKNKTADLVHSNYYSIDLADKIVNVVRAPLVSSSSREEVITRLFLTNFIGFETVLVRKNCFDEVGVFDERMLACSDHDVWMRIVGRFNIGFMDQVLVKKRQHEIQLSKATEIVLKDEFLLVEKAINRYPFLKKSERRKLSLLYYTWGIMLLRKGNYEDAKKKLLKALKNDPFKPKAVIAYTLPRLYNLVSIYYQKFASSPNSMDSTGTIYDLKG